MRILESASCIAVIVNLVIAAVRTTIIDDDDGIFALEKRNRRAVGATLNYTGCGHWSDWISRNTPNVSSSPNENEHFTKDDLDVLCPSAGGNTVNRFRCRDEKGEPINDIINKTDVSNVYVITCSNMSASCFLLNSTNSKEKCPDFALQIMCACPPTTSTSSSTIQTTSGTGGGLVTRSSTSGSGTGGGSVTGSGTGGGSVTGSETGGGSVAGSGTGDGSVKGSGTGGGSMTGNGTGGSIIGIESESGRGNGTLGSDTGAGSESVTINVTGGSGIDGSPSGTGNPDSLSGSSTANGNLSVGGTSRPLWIIPLVLSLVLFVVSLILGLYVYNKLKQQIRINQVGPI